jgi:hypothetical protein
VGLLAATSLGTAAQTPGTLSYSAEIEISKERLLTVEQYELVLLCYVPAAHPMDCRICSENRELHRIPRVTDIQVHWRAQKRNRVILAKPMLPTQYQAQADFYINLVRTGHQ